MDWFCALTEDQARFREYAEMVMVAVHTARKFTSLRPHVIYEGGDNEFTEWLDRHGVKIIRYRGSFRDELNQLGERDQLSYIAAGIAGTFLRVDLPNLVSRSSSRDAVLYTDCDVMFQRDVVPELAGTNCDYFAVAGEFTRDDYESMNAGVMLMNLPRLQETIDEFRNFISTNLDLLKNEAWDQGAFRRFYRRADGTRMWDKLRPELNWKPYWGKNPQAGIIHFHGPKPFQRERIRTEIPPLESLTGGAYVDLCREWDEFLAEAR